MSTLYILEIRPLSEVSLANMFSHTVGSLCNLVLFSLALQKLFILMRSHLFILLFMSLALGDMSVRMLLGEMSEIFCIFSPLSMMRSMALSYMASIMLRYISSIPYLLGFYHERRLNFFRCFLCIV